LQFARIEQGGPAIATLTANQSRVVLALVLLSSGIILMLAALVVRPDESHGSADAATTAGEHQSAEEDSEGATGDSSDHVDSSQEPTGAESEHTDATEVTTEHTEPAQDTSDKESEHEEVGQNQPESAHEDPQADTVLGVTLEDYNLASPRLVFVLIGLTVLLAVGLLFRRSVWLLAACVILGLAGVVISAREAMSAGEELGIFVPLPVLAAVLYAAAAGLAVLAIIKARTDSAALQST
jgi:hypothetical protein